MNKVEAIASLKEQYDSFYLYEEEKIIEHMEDLKNNFPSVKFLYSVKCNPNDNVLKTVFGQGFGADAASLNEVYYSVDNGLAKDQIYYSAPGKTKLDLEKAFDISVIIVDSISEIERIEEIASSRGQEIEIGVRINPNFTYVSDQGSAAKFGIDETQIFEIIENNNYQHIKFNGIHVHLKSQELDANKLSNYYDKMFALSRRIEEKLGYQLDYINLGSGIGIPYSLEDKEIDLKWLGKEAESKIADFKADHEDTLIMIEIGRYAVGKSGTYCAKVIDKKQSYGKTFVLLKNTLNGFVRPSIACMVESYAQEGQLNGTEPLYTGRNAFQFSTLKEDREKELVSLVGTLCTGADIIASDIEFPKLEIGDMVLMSNAGAYAAVLSPMQFSSQEKPAEIMLTKEGKLV